MRALLIALLLTAGHSLFAQTYTMPGSGTSNASTCSGNFYDSGGSGGQYSNNENGVYVFCPSTAGARMRISFSALALDNNDFLEIFDGNSVAAPSVGVYENTTTSPGVITASAGNATGCLTVRFTSNGSNRNAGWAATLSCVLPLACQTITANFVSSNPAPGAGGIVRVCQGQSVNFVGSGTFSTSGTGATYSWSFGDGTSASGTSVNHVFAAGSYAVNLTITDPNGCTNSNLINRLVQVSTTPTINTSATPATLCTNQFSALNANVTMNPYIVNCTPPVSGTTFLPDGAGGSYSTSITTDCYPPLGTITSANDFVNVCLTLEHSYLGDLDIEFICPNGQSITLKAYPGGTNTFLGAPIDDDAIIGPGTGRAYCFTPSAATLLVNGTTSSAGTPAGNSVVAGDYMPVDNFAGLIGCPLNGNWTIQVTDHLGSDNGYIFDWGFNLTAALNAAPSFTPTIVSQGWVANPNLYPVNATQANVLPTAMGVQCFTYSVTDNFGCTYTAPQCINVNCMSLPVGLVSFDAQPVENARVELSWVTESELDNERFEVDRSIDGESWEKIYVTSGAGDSQEELHYFTVDPSPYKGVSYYRLRQIDTDGMERVSDIDVVNLSADGLVIYPNPANDFLVLEGNARELETFHLLDALGKDVTAQATKSTVYDAKLELDISRLAKGTYMIRTTTATYLVVKQ